MKRLGWIGILVLLALAACDTTTHEAQRMIARAEQLVDTLPDSTVRLIDSVLRMPASLSERQRMDMALLQAEALFADRGNEISPVMNDDFFDDHDDISISPELERAADYYANKKQYAKAAHAALYNGFVQQHYNEKEAAMQSFKEAEQYGRLAGDSLVVAQAQYKMGRLLFINGMKEDALVLLQTADKGFGNLFVEKALVENMLAVCYMVKGEYETTEHYLQQSLLYADKSHSVMVKRKVLNNYAVLSRLQKKYGQAIACLRKIAEETNLDDTKLLLLNMNYGDVYYEMNKLDSAAFYYKQVDMLLPENHVKMETKASAYKSLSKFAENQDNAILALQYWKQYNYWLNEVRDVRERNNVFAVQKKYDYGALQNEMNEKTIQRQRLIIFLSIVVVLVLLAFTISQIRLSRIRKQETQIKASLLHFMCENEALAKQSETYKKAHHNLEQKQQETEEARQTLVSQVEKYKNAYETVDKKLSKALLKEQQIMQKMAVYLGNKDEMSLFDSLKYSVLGNQEYWNAMLKTFDQQFPGMRKELIMQHPDLTDMEQKILLLSYVDSSREDTALLLGISIFMVDKLRTSVKKKMAINTAKTTNK